MSAIKTLIVFNPTSGAAFTATMPPTSTLVDGLALRMKYIGPYAATFPITLQANTGQTIDGLSTYVLFGQGASRDFVWVAQLSMWTVE